MDAIHPGALVAPLILEPSGISQSGFARRLGFNQPQPVNELVKGKRNFTSKMALLFEQATEGKYPAEFWLLLQARWDLAEASRLLSNSRKLLVDPVPLTGGPGADISAYEYAGDLLKMANKMKAWRS